VDRSEMAASQFEVASRRCDEYLLEGGFSVRNDTSSIWVGVLRALFLNFKVAFKVADYSRSYFQERPGLPGHEHVDGGQTLD
jgi:hypothetical protein